MSYQLQIGHFADAYEKESVAIYLDELSRILGYAFSETPDALYMTLPSSKAMSDASGHRTELLELYPGLEVAIKAVSDAAKSSWVWLAVGGGVLGLWLLSRKKGRRARR